MAATDTTIGRCYHEVLGAWDAWAKAPEDSPEQDEIQASIDALELEIANQPADSTRGILIKLHLADRILDLTGTFRREPQWHIPERLVTSAMDDARRLAGPAAEQDGFTAPIYDMDAKPERDFWDEAANAVPLAYDPDADLERLWKERNDLLNDLLTNTKIGQDEGHAANLSDIVRALQIAIRAIDERIADIEPQHWHSVVLQASILATYYHKGMRRAVTDKIARRIVRWAGTGATGEPQAAERTQFSPEWQALAASEAVHARTMGEQHWQARNERADAIRDKIAALRAEASA